MTRSIVAALLLLTAGCGGGGGGGSKDAPFLSSVTPEVGSSRTIWTLSGEGFARDAEDNTVFFDGVEATVLGVGTGDDPVLLVTATNLSISVAEVVDVTVARGSKRSNPIAVGVVPSGSLEILEPPTWGSLVSFAVDGNTLYATDEEGLFENDLTTGEIRRLGRSGDGGLRQLRGVFVTNDGTLWISDESVASPFYHRVLRRTADGWDVLAADFSDLVVAVTRDSATGNVYVVSETGAERYSPTGQEDGSWNPVFPGTARSALFQSAKLYVSFPGANLISQIDPTTAAVTDFSTAQSTPGPLAGDGSNVFTNDGNDVVQISSLGAESPYYDSSLGSLPVAINESSKLARVGTELWVSHPSNDIVVSITTGAMTGDIETSGSLMEVMLVRLPTGELLTSGNSSNCEEGPSTPVGPIVALRPDGTARVLTTEMCPVLGLAVSGDDVYATNFQFDGPAVSKLNMSTGEVTAVATSAEGFAFAISAASDADGNVYVGAFDSIAGDGRIHRIAPDGTKTLDFATVPGFIPGSLAVVGDRLISAGLDLAGSGSAGPFFEVPLAGGTAVELGIAPLGTAFDGIASDGHGGFYATTFLELGGLVHVDENLVVTPLADAPDTGEAILGVEVDPVDGAILVTLFSIDAQASRVARVYP